jgi:hypothetical protein
MSDETRTAMVDARGYCTHGITGGCIECIRADLAAARTRIAELEAALESIGELHNEAPASKAWAIARKALRK